MRPSCVLLLSWLTVASCAHPTVGGAAAQALVTDGAILLDVRSPGEFSEGHLPGAINVPVQELEATLGTISADRSRPIIVYCRSGVRSARARALLLEAGYTQVEDLGARSNWK